MDGHYLVLLEGRVDSEYARNRAAEVAAGIRGVTVVVNNLKKLVALFK